MGKISLKNIKSEIAKSGASKGKIIYTRPGEKLRVRFLDDFEDGYEVDFHNSYEEGINVPCQEIFGRECPYCEDEVKTKKQLIWSVYDYASKEVKLLMQAVNTCSPVPTLTHLYSELGTLKDRDFEILQTGTSIAKRFTVIPLDKKAFRNPKAKPFSEQTIYKMLDKAFPSNNHELDEEDEDKPSKKTTSKTKQKSSKKIMNEPEEEWDEEETNDYESMTPKELYALCKERELDCKPKKSQEYYIDILEEADEEDEDGWEITDEDEEEEW